LGLWGQYALDPDRFHDEFLSVLYEVVQLFALEGEWTLSIELNWHLEAARILAPLVSIAGVLIVLTKDAWIGLTNGFIRFWKGHVIVVGLGEKGFQFAQSCQAEHKIVVIERNEDNPLIERARNSGIAVIVGDFLDESIMAQANVTGAKHLTTFCGNDGTSVELALRTRDYLYRQNISSDTHLRIHLHVNETRVSSRLEHYSKFYDDQKVAAVDFFSVYDLTARILLKKYPPDTFADVLGQKQVHIAIYNFGRLAEHILIETVRMCSFLNGSRIKFSIFDQDPEQKAHAMLSLHPGLTQLCEINYVEMPYLHPLQLDQVPDTLLQTVTEHVICMDNDDENLELALMLREILLSRTACNAPINVRMQHATGLAKLLESHEDEPEIPDGIYPFGVLDEVLYHENILSERLDELARALHEDFLLRRRRVETDPRLYTSLQEWSELPEPERKSNRLVADHLATKLRAVRCNYVKEEAEALARMEHDRWRTNKIYEGWKEGSQRIEGARINPFNVPWNSIDETEREEQIEATRRLPELLQSRLGWRIEREFYIGITGHRPHRLDISDDALISRIDTELGKLAKDHADKRLILVSPLAEGADRIVAHLALDKHGMALHVPLPLPFELYQTDFATDESLQEFKELVGKAEMYYEIPTRFGPIETLASHADGSPNEARDKQYALVGGLIAHACDELIAVYDGGPSNGTGGTADVVAWRESGAVPPQFLIDSDLFLKPEITKPVIIDSNT
jgi:hypothetical protein